MSSTIAWLDQSDEHQREMREAIGMFRDEGAVDELGMGRIRDAFSERLFPGTSVLWRRARYLFFVPWTYLLLEKGKGGRGSAEEQARRLQRQLARSLRHSEGDGAGVIGASGLDVKQPPDTILWAALGTWGVRQDPGSLRQVRAAAVAREARQGRLEEEVLDEISWHPRIPSLMPHGFPADVSFDLTQDEARLLADLLESPDAVPGTPDERRADSLLTALLRDGVGSDSEAPWAHETPSASPQLQEAVLNAGCFSDTIQGARLLYAHLVAESQKDDELREDALYELDEWAGSAEGERGVELRAWAQDLDGFFALVRAINPRIGSEEEAFVRQWSELALRDPSGLSEDDAARELLIHRERASKGLVKARLRADGSVGRDARAVLPGPLTFRWNQARSIVDDIALGLDS